MKKLKTAVLGLITLTVLTASTLAVEVNETEIRSTSNEIIQFESYNGPHMVIESANAITGIGTSLGQQVARDVNKSGTYGNKNKYQVMHIVDPDETTKLDADIIFINEGAGVDHIKNLRRIITGYLQSAYGYNATDASTLSTFITVYNAVYRGRMDVFESKYKTAVTENLTAEKCGLSTRWSNWPGQTQIVIPLFDLNSALSSVDTSILNDDNVRDSMRENDDKGIDERKNMVDLIEREAEDYSDKAQDSAEEAAEARKELAEQQKESDEANKDAEQAKKDAEQAKKDAAQAQKDAEQAKKDAQNNPNNKEAQEKAEETKQNAAQAQKDAAQAQKDAEQAKKDAAQAQKDAEQAKKDAAQAQKDAEQAQNKADEAQQKTDEQKDKVTEAEQKASEQQAIADKKQQEAQNERTEIAKDQQKVIIDSFGADSRNTVVGLKLVNKQKNLCALVRLDAETGEVIRQSPVSLIHNRTVYPVTISGNSGQNGNAPAGEQTVSGDTMYLAICGDSGSAVRLCLLDSKNMEIQQESTELVAEDSVLVSYGNNYYCVIKSGNEWVVAKYDAKLNLQLKSPAAVSPDTPITIAPKGVVVTASNGQTILLELKDLKPISQLDDQNNVQVEK